MNSSVLPQRSDFVKSVRKQYGNPIHILFDLSKQSICMVPIQIDFTKSHSFCIPNKLTQMSFTKVDKLHKLNKQCAQGKVYYEIKNNSTNKKVDGVLVWNLWEN